MTKCLPATEYIFRDFSSGGDSTLEEVNLRPTRIGKGAPILGTVAREANALRDIDRFKRLEWLLTPNK